MTAISIQSLRWDSLHFNLKFTENVHANGYSFSSQQTKISRFHRVSEYCILKTNDRGTSHSKTKKILTMGFTQHSLENPVPCSTKKLYFLKPSLWASKSTYKHYFCLFYKELHLILSIKAKENVSIQMHAFMLFLERKVNIFYPLGHAKLSIVACIGIFSDFFPKNLIFSWSSCYSKYKNANFKVLS